MQHKFITFESLILKDQVKLSPSDQLKSWYSGLKSEICLNLLDEFSKSVSEDYKNFFLDSHLIKLRCLISVSKILNRKSLNITETQQQLEKICFDFSSIKKSPFFLLQCSRINYILCSYSLRTELIWFSRLNSLMGKRGYKVKDLRNLYLYFKQSNQILIGINWGEVLVNLILQAWQDSCLTTHNNIKSLIAKRTALFPKLVKNFLNYLENSLFSVVFNCFETVQSLHNSSIAGTPISLFLRDFSSYRLKQRNFWLSQNSILLDCSEGFPITKLNCLDYDFGDISWLDLYSSDLPSNLYYLLSIKEVRKNVSFFLDLCTFCPEIANRKISLKSFFSISSEVPEKAYYKLFNLLIEELDLFIVTPARELTGKGLGNRYTYKLSPSCLNAFLLYYTPKVNLPLVCNPVDWVPNSNSSQLYGGGYLSSLINGDNGICGEISNSFSFTGLTLNSLNKVQKTSYIVDNIFLNFIYSNFDISLYRYLISVPVLEQYSLLINKLFNSKFLFFFQEVKAFVIIKFPTFNNKKILRECNLIITSITSFIIDFFFFFGLAVEYSIFNQPFYYSVRIDSFCDLFFISNHLFCISGPSVAQNLIVPVCSLTEKALSFQCLPVVKYFKSLLKTHCNKKYFFEYEKLKLNNNILHYIPLNLSSHLLYFGLAGDDNALLEFNFFSFARSKKVKKECIYSFLLAKFLVIITKSLEILKGLKPKNVSVLSHNKNFKQFVALFTPVAIKIFISLYFSLNAESAYLSYIKYVSDLCSLHSIFSYLGDNPVFKTQLSCISSGIIFLLNQNFKKSTSIKKNYPRLISNSFVSSNRSYFLSNDIKLGSAQIYYDKKGSIGQEVLLLSKIENRPIYYFYLKFKNKIFDKTTAKCCIAGDVTSSLASVIRLNLFINCHDQNIPLIAFNGGVMCHVQNLSMVQNLYFNSYVDLVLKQDVLLNLLLNNISPKDRSFVISLTSGSKPLSIKDYRVAAEYASENFFCIPKMSSINLIIKCRLNRFKLIDKLDSKKYLMSHLAFFFD